MICSSSTPPHDSSGSSLGNLRSCFLSFGVPLSEEKTIGPATRLDFLGIPLDSVSMEESLPLDKLQRIRDIAASFLVLPYRTRAEDNKKNGYDFICLLGRYCHYQPRTEDNKKWLGFLCFFWPVLPYRTSCRG